MKQDFKLEISYSLKYQNLYSEIFSEKTIIINS